MQKLKLSKIVKSQVFKKAALLAVAVLFCGLAVNNSVALAAGKAVAAGKTQAKDLGDTLSVLYCIPFAGMLLSIAIAPLVNGEWWEKNKQYAVIFWSLLFLVPFYFKAGFSYTLEHFLSVILGDYLGFIILLFGLFCVAGNIELEGKLIGKPKVNALMLLIGTILSSWIGTTGASMLMIRPIIRANKWRRRKVQVIVFFIFLISNIGGCLTPVGDPPLLMGFTHGVPFTWSFHLMPVLILNVVLLLVLFYILDTRACKKDIAEGLKPKLGKNRHVKIKINGAHNLIFLAMIVIAVILSGVLPNMFPIFKTGIHVYKDVTMTNASIMEMIIILFATYLSFRTTKQEVRDKNHFTWDAIQEVAILFVGIFITMIPALLILEAKGGELGVNKPFQFFWVTGLLSSFLDNTPTYLVFFITAASSALKGASMVQTTLGEIPKIFLMAISCGAVFMGANTYIGNAPNLMVKSIAEENGIKMPSFFGYMFWSICCLIPVFIIDMLVFFL